MGGLRRTIGRLAAVAAAAAFVLCSGCASSSPARGGAGLFMESPRTAGQPMFPGTPPGQPVTPAPPVGSEASAFAGTPNPQALHQVIAEVQQLGALDPAAREELLENLRQTDPALWPLVVQQMHANLAWRRQAEQENRATSGPYTTPPATWPGPTSPAQRTAMRSEYPRTDATGAQSNSSAPDQRLPAVGGRRPVPNGDARQPTNVPPGDDFRAASAPPDGVVQGPPADRQGPPGAAQHATATSYASHNDSTSADDWRSHLSEAIRLLESDVSRSPDSDRGFSEHARLRLLYLAGSQRDAALRPIPSLGLALQEFWSKQLYGLATLLETDLIREPSRRNAEAKEHLSSAVAKLGESCPLVVRNLAFATVIDGYGTLKPFAKCEFRPGQRVLLYAELESFQSRETPRGFHTATRSSYQIFDSSGRRVAEHEFAPSEEYCPNLRRDYYIGYDFCLPQRIFPGRHVLQLTVVDLNSQKIGHSFVDFTIKSTED